MRRKTFNANGSRRELQPGKPGMRRSTAVVLVGTVLAVIVGLAAAQSDIGRLVNRALRKPIARQTEKLVAARGTISREEARTRAANRFARMEQDHELHLQRKRDGVDENGEPRPKVREQSRFLRAQR